MEFAQNIKSSAEKLVRGPGVEILFYFNHYFKCQIVIFMTKTDYFYGAVIHMHVVNMLGMTAY